MALQWSALHHHYPLFFLSERESLIFTGKKDIGLEGDSICEDVKMSEEMFSKSYHRIETFGFWVLFIGTYTRARWIDSSQSSDQEYFLK